MAFSVHGEQVESYIFCFSPAEASSSYGVPKFDGNYSHIGLTEATQDADYSLYLREPSPGCELLYLQTRQKEETR